MTITAAQQTALEMASVKTVYLVELQFLSSTQYLNTSNIPITWNGHTWAGLGTIGSISAIEESDSVTSKAMSFALNIADPAWLSLGAGSTAEYSGRPVKMYRCPLNDSYQLIDTPERCWAGVMDMVTIGIDGEQSSISMKGETGSFRLKRGSSLRMNQAQQSQRHPTDTGFSHLAALLANPVLWMSKKFQARD